MNGYITASSKVVMLVRALKLLRTTHSVNTVGAVNSSKIYQVNIKNNFYDIVILFVSHFLTFALRTTK